MDGQKYLAMLSCVGIKRGYTKDGEKIDTVSDSHSRMTCLSLQVQTSSKNNVSLYFHDPCTKMDKHDDCHAYNDIHFPKLYLEQTCSPVLYFQWP